MIDLDFSKRKARQAFYNSPEWKILRDYIISSNPLCDRCLDKLRITPATEVHHRVDIKDNPSLRLDMNNLQALCKPCHDIITAENRTNHDKYLKPLNTKHKLEVTELKKPNIK